MNNVYINLSVNSTQNVAPVYVVFFGEFLSEFQAELIINAHNDFVVVRL